MLGNATRREAGGRLSYRPDGRIAKEQQLRNYVHVEAGDVLTLRRSDMAGYMLRIQHPNTNRPDLVMFFTESTKQLLENLFRGIDQEQQTGDEMVGVAGYSRVMPTHVVLDDEN